ncbi:hypothetical protein Tco_0082893, partial [Tanacetum coccineum]
LILLEWRRTSDSGPDLSFDIPASPEFLSQAMVLNSSKSWDVDQGFIYGVSADVDQGFIYGVSDV